ncbi:MAG TPA: beta-N-acetylhexosaminidase [Caulobacteraceae bacterium]|jgi:beta-N-acetylhexosaminidase|nr:beta-N-acetylhexosaminidase [Caulobacteraceae bacterium]
MTTACILGCAGARLSDEERAFFRETQPWGFILFRRNVETPEQLRSLTEALRGCVGRSDAPVLIDQEGGRVQRMGPPHWPVYPPGRAYGQLPPAVRRQTARLGARLIAHDLAAVGINVDCLPVLDVPAAGAHDVIGDRAYAATPDGVAELGRAAAEGLMDGGVLPVIKHIPGHGRAGADSHHALPIVAAPLAELEADFAPFRALADMPMAMTAHVVYAAVDADQPATTSLHVIDRIIRDRIGFKGLLMSDDVSMKALSGDLGALAHAALRAGCDIVLHCNGDMGEMRAVVEGSSGLAGAAEARAAAALARIAPASAPFDAAEARARFEAAFEGRWAA